MNDPDGGQAPAGSRDEPAEGMAHEGLPAHPTGTLVIVLIYGALFALFWAWIYFAEFLGRGAPS